MSRISASGRLSPAALRAMFSTESDDTLIMLLTVYDPINTNTVVARLADGYTKRIYETPREVAYGVTSNGNDYLFLPITVSLPSEEDSSAPRCSITITDVTRHIIPIIRSISGPPRVDIDLVLASTPNYIEASFPGFYITNFTYSADSVQADLAMINYAVEPFPAFTFTPQYFPGLF